jgi:UDP-N-acetylglucosamine:LPS N-acetylglucosamine transferase
MVVGRSGASSRAVRRGPPSILIPYPFAADDHQMKNARSLEKCGAAVALRSPKRTCPRVPRRSNALAADPADKRSAMADAARKLGARRRALHRRGSPRSLAYEAYRSPEEALMFRGRVVTCTSSASAASA